MLCNIPPVGNCTTILVRCWLISICLNIYASQLPFWWSRVAGFCWGYWHGRVFSSIFRERSWYCHADVECPTCSCYRDFARCFPCRIGAGPRMMRTKRNKLHMQAWQPNATGSSWQFQPRHVQYVLLILQPMIHRDLHLHMSTRPLTSVSVSTTWAFIAMSASVEAQGWGGTAADCWYGCDKSKFVVK